VRCAGDLHIDAHHTVEDVGIVLGGAFLEALGDKRGITRFADATVPLDEALVRAVVDISGRPFLHYDVPLPAGPAADRRLRRGAGRRVLARVRDGGADHLHLDLIRGDNAHHIVEATFKAARARWTPRPGSTRGAAPAVPSTKGVL
jgi:imidazoleglycerol-phosphate dehydratase